MIPARVVAALVAWCVFAPAAAGPLIGRAPFIDRRNPPLLGALSPAERARADLGQLVFNTQWAIAGQPNAARRDGLGPLFIGASCDGCHNNGARGRGEFNPQRRSNSFVMQLGGPQLSVYGHVLNTGAIADFRAEGVVELESTNVRGHYPDGDEWTLFEPTYRVSALSDGALPRDVVLRPRIGPALFGAGLLEAVSSAAVQEIRDSQPRRVRGRIAGRFGWQAEAASIQDQTERAFAREMGLTSSLRPEDDCTARQTACLAAAHGGRPEVSDEFMHAVVSFQRHLAVPERAPTADADASRLFTASGCADCHRPALPVELDSLQGEIDAFTDLMVHDMGPRLADRTVAGKRVRSEWRTTPLWGLSHALQNRDVALLHDGRARTVEQAILWHGGQAEPARRAFMHLPRRDRERLLAWLSTL